MFKISTEQVNAILAYVGKRPYVEVAKIVNILQSLEKLEDNAEATEKEA